MFNDFSVPVESLSVQARIRIGAQMKANGWTVVAGTAYQWKPPATDESDGSLVFISSTCNVPTSDAIKHAAVLGHITPPTTIEAGNGIAELPEQVATE